MRCRFLFCLLLLAQPAATQAPDTSGVPRTTVSGVVYDSVGRAALVAAVVQLVAADGAARFAGTAVSDSLGRFTLTDVPAGRYMLGFFHAMLDSLGVEPPVREVYVDGRRPLRADVAIPSPGRLRAAICGLRPAADSGVVVVGVVRDARDGAPAAGVKVTGEWLEYTFGAGGLSRRTPRLVATTAANGWFAMCNLPSAGTIALMASRAADSTDLIEVEAPAERFLRRDLYIGPSRITVVGDTAARADTLAPPPTRLRIGDGRLSGVVVTAVGGRPLADAEIRIRDGPQTRANERGEWTLVGAPLGTRTLEVRAVGYYPERRPVDVVAGTAPIRTALSTMKAVLDTVRVTAARINDRYMSGFHDRRRSSGTGRYLTPEDIARRNPVVTSDLFRMVPGLAVERGELGDARIQMRGTFEETCSPAVYIDGRYMSDLSADDIDSWVKPNEVAGIEIYAGAGVPPQFTPGMGGGGLSQQVCGSIVIWTKVPPAFPNQGAWKRRVVKGLGVAVVAVGVGALLKSGDAGMSPSQPTSSASSSALPSLPPRLPAP